jgi:NAD+ kinase
VLSLICPHTLSSRPLVLPDSSRITVSVGPNSRAVLLAADGQVGRQLQPGDTVTVSRDERDVRFIHLPGYSYFAVLRQKLHWSGSSL